MVLFAAELGGSGSIGGTVIVLVRKQMPFVLYGCEWRLTWWFSRFLLLLGGVSARKKAFRGQFRDRTMADVPAMMTTTVDIPLVIAGLAEFEPAFVYLFGSAVMGGLGPSSDVDIAFLPERPCDPVEVYDTAQRLAGALGRDVDVCQRPPEAG